MMKFPLTHIEEDKERHGKLFNSPQREKIEINRLDAARNLSTAEF